MGKFWTSRRALTEGLIPFAVEAFNTFLPFCKPVTRPISAWPVAAGRKALVTSAPFALTWTFVSGTSAGTSSLTSTSPPLTRSGAVESVVITRDGESANPDVAAIRARTAMQAWRNQRVFMGDLLVWRDVRAAPATGRAAASDSRRFVPSFLVNSCVGVAAVSPAHSMTLVALRHAAAGGPARHGRKVCSRDRATSRQMQ